MLGCCFQKLFSTHENRKHSKTRFTIPNPHAKNILTSPQICVLKSFFSNFLLQMWKLIGYSVGDGGNAAIWTSHGQWRWVNICVHERDKRIGEMEVLRWKIKKWVWIMWNERRRLWEERQMREISRGRRC